MPLPAPPKALRPWIRAGTTIGRRWRAERHSRSAAALAFYSLFSLVPILVLASSLAALVIGRDRAEKTVGQAAETLFDEHSSDYLRQLLDAQPTPAFAGISSILSAIVIVYIASKVVRELRLALDTIFGRPKPSGRRQKVIGAFAAQGVPMLLVLATGLVVAVSAVIDSTWRVLARQLDQLVPIGWWFWEMLHQVLSFGLMTLLFVLVLKWLPSKPPGWRPAAVGAGVTVVLLAVLKQLVQFYFSLSGAATAYGAAVTLVVILLWIFFTVQLFFLGAETAAYLQRRHQSDDDPPDQDPPGN